MNKILAVFVFLVLNMLSGYGQCWSKIESGSNHTVAIHQDGTLWAWGANSNGEIGNGTTNNSNIPVLISSATNWSEISAGYSHTLALKSDGTLWAWGYDVYHSLGLGNGIVQINVPTQIGTDTNWSYISAGHSLSFAIKADGSLWGWGVNINGEIGDGTITPKTIPTRVGTANDWAKVFTGNSFTAAIKTNGTLWTWGTYNNSGELGYGNYSSAFTPQQVGNDTNWSSVSTENMFALGLKTNGTIWAWGSNSLGELGLASNISYLSPTQIGTDTDWKQVEAGNWKSFFVKNNGTLWATGQAFLGNGTAANSNTLIQIGTSNNWKKVSSQLFQTIGLQTNNIGYGWGSNYFGQIGNGYTDNGLINDPNDYSLPVAIICPCTQTLTPTFSITQNICAGSAAPSLPTVSNNAISGTWSPSVISNTTNATYVFTPNVSLFPCAAAFSLAVNVLPVAIPTFATMPTTLCQFQLPPVLPTSSTNAVSITGSWNPPVISTTTVGQITYTFIPDSGQCVSSTPYQITVTVNSATTSNFNPIGPICLGDTPPVLSNTAPNGVQGTWSPSVVNNMASGDYEFTPSAAGCVAKQILHVNVLTQTVPNFPDLSFCKGNLPPILATTSPNGITGSWSPSAVNAAASGNYLFTPHPNQCASNQNITVTVNQMILQTLTYEVSAAFSGVPTVTIITFPSGNYLYQLDNGNVQQSPVFENVGPGPHQVTVTDANGCSMLLQLHNIVVIDYPHFFTPNGDGHNDYWNITGFTANHNAHIYIYDRFGKLLKQLRPTDHGWNGTYNGYLMPATDYWFRVEYKESNIQKEYSSHFALKR